MGSCTEMTLPSMPRLSSTASSAAVGLHLVQQRLFAVFGVQSDMFEWRRERPDSVHVEYAVDEDSQIVAVCFTGESEGWLEVRSCRESCNAIFDTARLVLAMGATFRAVRQFSHVKLISDTPVLYQLMLSKDYL